METRVHVFREQGWTTVGDWERQGGTGETTETMEVYREQGWTTAGDWGRQRGTGETTETMETRVYREQGWTTTGDWGGGTVKDWGDHGDEGSLHRDRGIHNMEIRRDLKNVLINLVINLLLHKCFF